MEAGKQKTSEYQSINKSEEEDPVGRLGGAPDVLTKDMLKEALLSSQGLVATVPPTTAVCSLTATAFWMLVEFGLDRLL